MKRKIEILRAIASTPDADYVIRKYPDAKKEIEEIVVLLESLDTINSICSGGGESYHSERGNSSEGVVIEGVQCPECDAPLRNTLDKTWCQSCGWETSNF